jgi:hypothetical protein
MELLVNLSVFIYINIINQGKLMNFNKNKRYVKLAMLLLTLNSPFLFAACGPKIPTDPIESGIASPIATATPAAAFNYLDLKADFIKKAKTMFTGLPYQGYVKIIKEGNSTRFIYINEVASDRDVDLRLHQQAIIMDLDNKQNTLVPARPLATSDPENVDLNSKKINIIFSGKCADEYLSEISTDIDKYSAYEYFKITKEGYNVEIIYGGKEYDRFTSLTEERYYRTTYRLGLDRCDRQTLTTAERVARPFGNTSPVPTATPVIGPSTVPEAQ